jgi:beta-glucosidase-like glycosyl hydrolase
MSGMLAALHTAIDSGSITTDRIDQSVNRILRLKARFGLLPLKPLPNVTYPGSPTAPAATATTAFASFNADFRHDDTAA